MNILILVNDIFMHVNMMWREWTYMYEAAKKNQDVNDVQLWGPGLGDWKIEDLNKPVETIVKDKCGDEDYFHVIVVLPGHALNMSYYHRKNPSDTKRTAIFMHLFNMF